MASDKTSPEPFGSGDNVSTRKNRQSRATRAARQEKTWGDVYGGDDFGFGALSYNDARARIAARPTTFLVEGLIASDTYGVLAGAKGVGKTVALLDLAVAVALGESWFGRFTCERRRVLVMTCEDPEAETWRRASAIARSVGHDPVELNGWLFVHPDPYDLTSKAKVVTFSEELMRVSERVEDGFGLVVIDPAYKYLAGADPSNLFGMGALLTPLQLACAERQTALMVGHHFNRNRNARRGERLSGAGLLEWARVIFELDAPDPLSGAYTRAVTVHVQGNSIADTDFVVKRTIRPVNPDANAELEYSAEITAEGAAAVAGGSSPANRIYAVMVEDRARRRTADDIAALVGADGEGSITASTVRKWLNKEPLSTVVVSDGKKPASWWLRDEPLFAESALS